MAAHEANHIPDPLDHVLDDPQGNWEIFERLFGGFHLELPKIFGFQITKFMVLELLAAILIAAIFIPLCRRAHFAARSQARTGRARIGSPARKRRRSSASALALA